MYLCGSSTIPWQFPLTDRILKLWMSGGEDTTTSSDDDDEADDDSRDDEMDGDDELGECDDGAIQKSGKRRAKVQTLLVANSYI